MVRIGRTIYLSVIDIIDISNEYRFTYKHKYIEYSNKQFFTNYLRKHIKQKDSVKIVIRHPHGCHFRNINMRFYNIYDVIETFKKVYDEHNFKIPHTPKSMPIEERKNIILAVITGCENIARDPKKIKCDTYSACVIKEVKNV